MQNQKILPIIMCGGSGTRLWPLSRSNFPKQFLNLVNNETSLLQDTIIKANKINNKTLIIGNYDHRFIIKDNIRKLDMEDGCDVILEKVKKNTLLPAIIGCLYAKHNGYNKALIMPSDHIIGESFVDIVKSNIENCNCITTFAISTTSPNTGYGYIRTGDQIQDNLYMVESFKEKPNLELARQYVKDSSMYYNSGIFLLECDHFLDEVRKFSSKNLELAKIAFQEIQINSDKEYKTLSVSIVENIENISIDYGIIEKTKNINTIVCNNMEWNDLGTFSSIYDAKKKINDNNVIMGDDVICKNSQNLLVSNNTKDKIVFCNNVNNLAICVTQDAIMISDKESSSEIGDFVKNNTHKSVQSTNFDHRPWGMYENILEESYFKVKKITVSPLKSISLQTHSKRSEHWIVTSGAGQVTLGDKIQTIKMNESVCIPVNIKHRITNLSHTEDLVFIEVQCGEYFGEDDIIRYNDDWGR